MAKYPAHQLFQAWLDIQALQLSANENAAIARQLAARLQANRRPSSVLVSAIETTIGELEQTTTKLTQTGALFSQEFENERRRLAEKVKK